MRNFFITGLPRSRTAWLAAFMNSADGVLCYHEGIDGCQSIDDYNSKMSHEGYEAIGDSDTGVPILDIPELFPDSPIVVISRDKDDVSESLKRIYGDKDYMPILEDLDSRMAKLPALFINFNEIDRRLEEIWHHCIDLPYNPTMAKIFQNMRIEIMSLEFDQKTIEKFGGDLCLG